ncbi:SDR family oxidoreductase [Priestia endophytica]|nr:SDR family oxidoreductase [Priestia endophytica]
MGAFIGQTERKRRKVKTVLITGASGGIGKEIARTLSNHYRLVLHYHRNEESVRALALELEDQTEVFVVSGDLSKEDGVTEILQQIVVPIDALVYNCGKSQYGLLTDVSNEELSDMLMLHVQSPLRLVRELLPSMVRKREGSIVLVSSIWGLTGASCETVYSTVKGAQNAFVKALAKEVGLSGIRVNAIAPGVIDTPMVADFNEEEKRMMEEEIPLGRMGRPDEVANVAEFLLSEKASYITGQIISANGGWYT